MSDLLTMRKLVFALVCLAGVGRGFKQRSSGRLPSRLLENTKSGGRGQSKGEIKCLRKFAAILLTCRPVCASFNLCIARSQGVFHKRVHQQQSWPHSSAVTTRMNDIYELSEMLAVNFSDPLVKGALRIALPSAVAAVAGILIFDDLSVFIRSVLSKPAVNVLKYDAASQIEDFCSVSQLLFALVAGSAAGTLYEKQVSIYDALFQEVSVAKSLLEQTVLVCWGRPWYPSAIACMRDYVENDLCCFSIAPVQMVARKPKVDPLESILYMTSIGEPGIVYDSISTLRSARADRLGALQRQYPTAAIVLLYFLAVIDLLPFTLLGAGIANDPGVLYVESLLFGFLTGTHMVLLRIIDELGRNSGGLFSVDEVLQQMVAGLREELDYRAMEAPELNPADANADMVPDWDFSLLQNMSSDRYP